MVEIIHAGAAKMTVADREAGGFDDMGFHAEARAKPENRSGILRDVRLEKSNTHSGTPLSACKMLGKIFALRGFCASSGAEPIAGLRSPGKGANRSILDRMFRPIE
ncbi:MAG: hypothetical protein ACTHM2_04205 [Afipia sp.]